MAVNRSKKIRYDYLEVISADQYMCLNQKKNIIKIAVLLTVFLINVGSDVLYAKNISAVSGHFKTLSIGTQLESSNILLQPIIDNENEEDETNDIFIQSFLGFDYKEGFYSYNFTKYFEKSKHLHAVSIWRLNRNLRL